MASQAMTERRHGAHEVGCANGTRRRSTGSEWRLLLKRGWWVGVTGSETEEMVGARALGPAVVDDESRAVHLLRCWTGSGGCGEQDEDGACHR